jgi:type I restriction enzyme S subunit
MKKGWQTKTLECCCEQIFAGGDVPKDRLSKERTPKYSIPIYSNGEKDDGLYGFTDVARVIKPSITVSARGTLGFTAIRTEPFLPVVRLIVLVPDEKQIVLSFLYYALLGMNFGNTGTSIPQLTVPHFKELLLPVPPLAEQQRIVAVLDEAFAGLATAQAHAEKNLQNARELFDSYLEAVFAQRGESWVERILGDVCEFVGGSQPPKAVFSKTKTPNSIRLIQIRDYKSDNHVVYIPKAQARRLCTADDIMIGRYGPPIFQILRGLEGAYNVALMKAVPDEAQVNREFLFYFLKHPAILEYVIYHSERAAGQIGVTKETLAPYPIAMPSLDKQAAVAANIDALAAETQRLQKIYEQKLVALAELKKSLLHQAFSGEL